MKLSESREDYLEAIYEICKKEKVARVKSIAEQLGVSLASVNYAVGVLQEAGLTKHKRYGYIELTERGSRIGKSILEKHRLIRSFLMKVLNVEEEIADKDACRMEHSLSNHTMEKIAFFMKSRKV
ncbi:MAG: metal-dependent transcriptional regulator [candidate division WOR-3 bacterium]|nr:metal-dependent transcriptional regulator [candidate division WOR-3 bacterium]